MTFSDKRIVEFVTKHFVPVWESVADVSTAAFDLGDGRVIKGTLGGEIAIFFCLPDGRTYDVLPALQPPNATYSAIVAALEEFQRVKDDPVREVPASHVQRLQRYRLAPERPKSKEKVEQKLGPHYDDYGGEEAYTMMLGQKMLFGSVLHRLVVVEPGGLGYYTYRIHQLLSQGGPLRTPLELRKPVFEEILEMKLVSRHKVFTPDSEPEPFMFTQEVEK